MYKTLVSQLRFLRHVNEETAPRLLTSAFIHWAPSRSFSQTFVRNAGHSKWANIRHTKGAKDLERSKTIVKYVQRVNVAIKLGNGVSDPSKNSRLAQVLEEAKDAKIPLSAINKILETAQSSQSEGQDEVYALKGPGRAIFLVHTFTSQRKKAKDLLNSVAKKTNATWQPSSVLHMFEHVGQIVSSTYNNKPVTKELLEDATTYAIEAGAEDVEIDNHPEFGTVLVFTTNASNFYQIKTSLNKLGFNSATSDLTYIPKVTVSLTDEEIVQATNLYNKLMEHDFVVAVYDNIDNNIDPAEVKATN